MKQRTVVLQFVQRAATLAALFLVGMAFAGDAQAQRKGFVLNLGLGMGRTTYGAGGFDESKIAITTDFKIGFAPTDHLLIYYSNDAAFFSLGGNDEPVGDPLAPAASSTPARTSPCGACRTPALGRRGALSFDYLVASGLTAIGASWFLNPSGPGFFFDASLGISVWSVLDTDNAETETFTGLGYAVGGGYEFARHWLVDFDLILGNPSDDFGGSLDTRTLRIAFNWLLY